MKNRKYNLRTFNKKNCLILLDESLADWQYKKTKFGNMGAGLDERKADTILFVLGLIRIAIIKLKDKSGK